MKLQALLETPALDSAGDCDVTGLQNDSRLVKPGDLFIAYPGFATDGRLYVQQAIQAGAAAIVYEAHQLPSGWTPPSQVTCIARSDLAKEMPSIAARFFKVPSHGLSITGVTGTNGKTTVAYQLAQAYELLGLSSVYIGTLGQGRVGHIKPVGITTPDALYLQRLLHDYYQSHCEQICMEVSSHALSQDRVAAIEFHQAIFTNLSHDHLDYHESMQAYAQAKAKLFEFPSLKWALINHDDPYGAEMTQHLPVMCQKLTYGLMEGCDVRALNTEIHMFGSEFDVSSPWGIHHIRSRSIGVFNIYNSLAVFASLMANGCSEESVLKVMSQLHASPGRMEIVCEDPCVIVDYAHTPDALENVMSTLTQLKQGKLWVVFGCGGDRDKTKRPLMGRIASQYADRVVITSDNPRHEAPDMIVDEIAQGILPHVTATKILDRRAAIQHALDAADKRDIVLVAGKGHESYQQIGNQRLAFSDQAIVREHLNHDC